MSAFLRYWFGRCDHENTRGIYGDEIVSTIRAWRNPALARVRCLNCGRALYGRPLSSATHA